jgi:cytochrome c oxidase assembly protein subunit 15
MPDRRADSFEFAPPSVGGEFAPPSVGGWLLIVALLVFVMVMVGGATRLTESGLSITEWQPLTGTVPPLNDGDWAEAFQKYRQIPEYRIVNPDMTLSQFKTIYWWEWSHRFLGRLIGAIFLLPFIYFLIRRRFPSSLKPQLWGLFFLGAVQGALGWFMVQSGLSERIDVSHYRLAAHLNLAFLIYAAALWLGFGLRYPEAAAMSGYAERRARLRAWGLVLLLVPQLVLGAFVAGLDAGKMFTDWPLMNGKFVPEGLFQLSPVLLNFTENYAGVQFLHRMLAYALLLGAFAYYLWARGNLKSPDARNSATLIPLVLVCQALLGIWALLNAVPLALGLAHQFGALIVIAAFVWHFHCLTKRGLSEYHRPLGSDITYMTPEQASVVTNKQP